MTTSSAALATFATSGRLGRMQRAVLRAIAEHGPQTGGELNRLLRSNSAHKRLVELERFGMVRREPARTCAVSGYTCLTWEVVAGAMAAVEDE